MSELEVTGKTITLKWRWNDFTHVTRAGASPKPIQTTQEIMQIVSPPLDQLLQEKKSVHLLGDNPLKPASAPWLSEETQCSHSLG